MQAWVIIKYMPAVTLVRARSGVQAVTNIEVFFDLTRSAYYWIHPVMIAGIIAVAAGDRFVLANPLGTASSATALALLGGSAIFLTGHALFKRAIWRSWSWTRIAAIVVLALLTPVGLRVPGLAVSAFAVATVTLVVILDRFHKLTASLLSGSVERVPAAETPTPRSLS